MRIHKKFVIENYVPISELKPAPNYISLSEFAYLAICKSLAEVLKLEKPCVYSGFGAPEIPVVGLPDGLRNCAEVLSIRGKIIGAPTLNALIRVAEEDFDGPLPKPPKESFAAAERAMTELGLSPPPFQTLEVVAAYDGEISKLERMAGDDGILNAANRFVNVAPYAYLDFMDIFRRGRKGSARSSLREINPDIYAREIESVGEERFFRKLLPLIADVTYNAALCVLSELSRRGLKRGMEIAPFSENLHQVPKPGESVKVAEYAVKEKGLLPFVVISGAFDRTNDRMFTSKSRVHLDAAGGAGEDLLSSEEGEILDAVFEALNLFRGYLVNKGSGFWDFMLGEEKEVRSVKLNTDLRDLARTGDVSAFVEAYALKSNFRLN